MGDTEATGRTVDVTPTFHYHRHIEIVKRFVEQLTARVEGGLPRETDLIDYVRTNLPHVRDAMSHVLADDVERQIRITEDFPIHWPGINFHEFEPWEQNREACAYGDGTCGRRSSLVHTL